MALSEQQLRLMLERLEAEAKQTPARHRVRVVAALLLGYLYPVALAGLVVGGCALALSTLNRAPSGLVAFLLFVLLVVGLSVLVVLARTLILPLDAPVFPELEREDAPRLWELVEEVRGAGRTRRVHRLHLDPMLNASVGWVRPWGMLSRPRAHLVLGVPLLMALTVDELRSVIAHELGHLDRGKGGFGAWVYRLEATWEAFAKPLQEAGVLRRVLLGWFVDRYRPWLDRVTLPTRRLHEYHADRRAAELTGAAQTARTLLAIDWQGYRLGSVFFPALFRLARDLPTPPADLHGELARFLATPAPSVELERWRRHELGSRTPLALAHPCLRDRLEALGQAELLRSGEVGRPPGDDAAINLLGAGRERLLARVTAWWKLMAIEAWRQEYAGAQHARELAKRPETLDSLTQAERDWEALRLDTEFADPPTAMRNIRAFLERHPTHGPAHFVLAGHLLRSLDEAFHEHYELAMRHDSGLIGPALNILYQHYRGSGRDEQAEPLRLRRDQHEADLLRARKERLDVAWSDRLDPHGLHPSELLRVRRVLHRHPRIRAAYLGRKRVSTFSDKPSYVLGVQRYAAALSDRGADARLVQFLQAEIPISVAIVLMHGGRRRWLRRLREVCPEPIYDGGAVN